MAVSASLVATLGLDSAKFAAGLDKAAKKGKSFKKRLTDNFNGLQTAFLGVTAALGTQQLLDNADAMIKMADNAGIGFEEFQRLAHGLKNAGVNDTALGKGLVKLNKHIKDSGDGLKTSQRLFDELGISFRDLEQLKPEERFEAVIRALDGIEDPGRRAAVAQELLGKQFGQVAIDMDEVISEGDKIVTINEEQARSAEGINDAMSTLGTSLSNLAVNVLGPLVEKLVPVVESFAAFAKEHPQLTQLGVALAAVGTAIAVMGGPISLVAAAIAGLVLAYQNWGDIVDWVKGKLDAFGNAFMSIFEKFSIEALLQGLKDGVLKIVHKMLTEIGEALSNLPLIGEKVGRAFKENVLRNFEETYEDALLNSPIPDLVNGVEEWMSMLPGIAERAGEGFKNRTLTSFENTLRDAKDMMKQFDQLSSKIFDGMADALTDFVMTGKLNFKDFARSIIQDLIRIQIRASLSNLFTSFLGGGGFPFGGARAMGGPVTAGKSYLVGEKGPELFTPSSSGSITPNDQMGGNNVTINISGNVDQRAIQQIRQVVGSSPDVVGGANRYFDQSTRGLQARRV